MPKYKLTNKAVEDLSGIWNYTYGNWSEKQADMYYYMLLENFVEIANIPLLGKNYAGIEVQLFGFRAGHHIIFYRIFNKNFIEITRILHEQMDMKNRMKN